MNLMDGVRFCCGLQFIEGDERAHKKEKKGKD
jgi:hypothetical protein